jgi:site-specific DNA-methyltransferase (adenine-specific)
MSLELLGELELNKIHQMDCLEGMKLIPDKSIDMILCDLPYGTTACKWDEIIPFDELWDAYRRVIKPNGAIVLTATQPFSSMLVASNVKGFKHEWIWQKEKGVGFQVAKYRPMQEHEHVLVFTSKGEKVNYYPIKEPRGKVATRTGARSKSESSPIANLNELDIIYTDRYPTSIKKFKRDSNRLHPTQKPVALFEYLIRTYTKEGEVVLDNCMGSGTTAVACVRTNRKFIGFEIEPEYVKIANQRLDSEVGA